MRFGSEEYLKKVMEVTNSDERYSEMVRNEDATYTFLIEPEPENGVRDGITLGYSMKGGKMVDIWLGERETDFVISGRYGIWVDLVTGRTGVTSAFLQRKLRIRGEFSRILRLSKPTEYWIQLLRRIPTEFDGIYSRYNIG
ncbi:MAG: SCP2 sterol-binding domain-containing protein [Thermoplasmata archaeon]|jgi:putative sterol carrier protein|nr:MAG: hypothetical protein C0180_01435 [Aciduliprofundum sp.]HEU13027.1 hypothetical protein [Euryarchaeota archaeon]